MMKRITVLTLAILFWCADVSVGRAQWGWPAPGYSVSTMRACDGCRYRGLCEVLRDRRGRSRDCNPSPETAPGPKGTGSLPNSEDGVLHQPAPVAK